MGEEEECEEEEEGCEEEGEVAVVVAVVAAAVAVGVVGDEKEPREGKERVETCRRGNREATKDEDLGEVVQQQLQDGF